MSIFKYLHTYETKQDFLIRYNINKIENKNKLFLYNLKILTELRNQYFNIVISYNKDSTRNPGNCYLACIYLSSYLANEIGNLRFYK